MRGEWEGAGQPPTPPCPRRGDAGRDGGGGGSSGPGVRQGDSPPQTCGAGRWASLGRPGPVLQKVSPNQL